MTVNTQAADLRELKPRITVFGIGGAGGNAVNNMAEQGLEGVEFVVANTDAQALAQSKVERQIQLGTMITEGLGAGSCPEIGAAAAEDSLSDITDCMHGSHMCFITAGMGGGTGTGAAPVIARAARELDILTVGVVTKPFQFEGARRMDIANRGINELELHVDTLIIIPNQNLFRIANEHTTFSDAFAMADQVLMSGVSGITDLMVKEGLINLDFADVRTIMKDMGKAMMGTGESSGEKRAIEAAEAAISNPLLNDVSMKGAKGLLISITGSNDLTLYEVDEAASRIRSEVDPEANIILGATFDNLLNDAVRVSVVATGIDTDEYIKLVDKKNKNNIKIKSEDLTRNLNNSTSKLVKESSIIKNNNNLQYQDIKKNNLYTEDNINKIKLNIHLEKTKNIKDTSVNSSKLDEFIAQRPIKTNKVFNKSIKLKVNPLSKYDKSNIVDNITNNISNIKLSQQSPAYALRTDDFSSISDNQKYEVNEIEKNKIKKEKSINKTLKRNRFFDRLANISLGLRENYLVNNSNKFTKDNSKSQINNKSETILSKSFIKNTEKKTTNTRLNLEIPTFLRR